MAPLPRLVKVVGFACTLVACAGTGSADLGVDGRGVLLGQSLPLSGEQEAQAQGQHAGARLHFDAINAQGGVHGRRVEVLTLDHGGDAQRALANTRKLIYAHRVFALFGYLGGEVANAHHAIVQAERLPLLVSGEHPTSSRPQAYQRYFFQLAASAADSNPRIYADYLAALAARDATAVPDPSQFAGYLAARVMTEALARCGRDLSREKLIAALETLEREGVADWTIAFAPSHRIGQTLAPDSLLAQSAAIAR